MKITFISNYLNHHQLPFCLEMKKIKDVEFNFIATEKISEVRLKLGYEDMNSKYDFVIEAYKEDEKQKALNIAEDSDVVIIGSAPEIYIKERLKENKITFRYSERIFKKGKWQILNFKLLASLYKHNTIYNRKNLYLLCASAYTAGDFSIVGAYKNKAYKWGYFPEIKEYDINQLIKKKSTNKNVEILWVGRYLKWKNPEAIIKLAIKLKKNNERFKINMLGTGELEEKIKKLVKKNNLQSNINILGSMSTEQVRKYMEEANIFIFSSDRNEGWGAVLNEAMNSGCVVVANNEIGSVPFLLKDNENGFIYKNNNQNELYIKVKEAMNNQELSIKLGKNAYETMINVWNAKTAANNLITLIEDIKASKESSIKEGPCSKAKVIIK